MAPPPACCERCKRALEPDRSSLQRAGGHPVCLACYEAWIGVRGQCERLFLANGAFLLTGSMPPFLSALLGGELGPEGKALATHLLLSLDSNLHEDYLRGQQHDSGPDHPAWTGGALPGSDRGGGSGPPQIPGT